jgi:hypothetical protein
MNHNELLRRAMRVLAPTADYVQRDDQIEWNDQIQEMPSAEEIEAEVQRQAGLLYQDSRAAEYPPIGDQLDALWKGGAAAEEMLATVMAVKAKYPKPE